MPDKQPESSASTTINERTTVPLTWVVAIVLTLVSGFTTIFTSYTWLDAKFDTVFKRLDAIENKRGDRFQRSDMVIWVSDLKERNPTLSIPDLPPKHEEH